MFGVETGDVEALNLCTVVAKRKAKWPPQGQATEDMRRPDWPLQGVGYECDPSLLKSTGTCKPEGELPILKSAGSRHLVVKTEIAEIVAR